MKKILILLTMLAVLGACKNRQAASTVGKQNPGLYKGVLKEVLQTNEYTYLLLRDKGNDQWVAVPKMEAETGQTYYYKDGLEMPGFVSKELNRKFSSVLFLESVYTTPPESTPQATMSQPHGSVTTDKEEVNIDKEEGIVSLAELFANPKDYEGKTIRVKGKVIKYNPAIMNKNWLHIQDGTDFNGKFDLTVTSVQVFKPGDVVTLEGGIVLNKDFGYGYTYEVLMEDAEAVK